MADVIEFTTQRERERPKPKYNDWRDTYSKLADYALRSGELYRVKMRYNQTTKDYEPEYIPLANFTAHIAKELVRDDGQEAKTVFEVEGFLAEGRELLAVNVDAGKFASMSWVPELWGSDVIVSPGTNCKDYLRHAIQQVSFGGNKTRQTVYTHTGWRKIGGKWVYLHAGGAIGTNDVVVDVSAEGYLTRYTLPQDASDKLTAAQMALKVLDVADYRIMVPVFALVHLVPLCEALRQSGREPAFVLWLAGVTQSMKSSLAAVALSFFGDFTALNLPACFKDTANSIERKGFLLKDSLIVVDDFHPSATRAEAQEMNKKAQMILRGYGDRVGRGRLWADGSLRKSFPPRGMCLTTGEDLPDVGQSGTSRYLAVGIQKGDIDTSILSELQANTGLLSGHMRSYIEWLIPHLDEIARDAREQINQLRDKFIQGGLSGRIPDIIAWLYFGLCMGAKYLTESGALEQAEHDELLLNGLDALMEAAREQARLTVDEQPVNKFIGALRELLTTKQANVKAVLDASEPLPGFIGWVDDDYYYLLPEVAYSAVVQFYVKQNAVFPVSKTTLWKHLKNAGYVLPEDNQVTRQKKINGKKYRLIWLRADTLKDDAE